MVDNNPERRPPLWVRLGGQVVLKLLWGIVVFVLFIDILILLFTVALGNYSTNTLNLIIDIILLPVLIYALILIRRARKKLRVLPLK